ncbi:helix-turn-helix domain-containing protein [Micromonospora sp. DT233]|uniref:helix-turn-helix domain-containing protein n=1 Tax=Micromonospora sp. DT233 TaxID=3393432 RepID=UPI003CEA7EE7
MTQPTPPVPDRLGPLLARLRQARGRSQQRLAAELCAASGVPTLSRHEVSRWERQRRVPGGFWLGWLAVVLAVPVELLAEAAGRSRPTHRATTPTHRATPTHQATPTRRATPTRPAPPRAAGTTAPPRAAGGTSAPAPAGGTTARGPRRRGGRLSHGVPRAADAAPPTATR